MYFNASRVTVHKKSTVVGTDTIKRRLTSTLEELDNVFFSPDPSHPEFLAQCGISLMLVELLCEEMESAV